MGFDAKPSLRDQKKEATATALAEVAFELALEHGLDGFVVDDVAQRAGYSRRTFANYFSCKEDAVAAGAITIKNTDAYESFLAGLPKDTPPLELMHLLLKMQLTAEFMQQLRKFVLLSKRHPTLEPYLLSVFHRLQMSAQEVMNEFSHGRYPVGYTHLLAGAVYGAFMPLLDGSLNVYLPGQPEEAPASALPFEQYVESIFAYLRNGF
ncbi:TetR/AcrR family transcriptional regulator [Paenibacillus montanisoli]|uniref:TetR family transcriptional regulator n=1 Tax=Paenibacillus montanisoli TaxID=2081970 RepID=A0A328U2K3_9BACL|nr:TetR/AcrR family transcriptional regulator [Paenibacillus montanisoli]RAP77027.1 TetR family transcriptional regulator [Paenibacillus montanisoli]